MALATDTKSEEVRVASPVFKFFTRYFSNYTTSADRRADKPDGPSAAILHRSFTIDSLWDQ